MVARRSVVLVVVLICVALAGCSALGLGGDGGQPGTSGGDGATDDDGGSTPWGTDELTVGISAPDVENRTVEEPVREAVAFWEPKAGSETPFAADLTLDPAAEDPDVRISYIPLIENCNGEEGTFYWCAPALPENPDTYTIRVSAGLADPDLRNATVRAFSAALATDPAAVPGTPTVERPRFRDPWPGSPTVVALDAAATDRPVEPLVESALSYWDEADEAYGNYTTSFAFRPDAPDPDILVRFVPSVDDCGHASDDGFIGCAPVLTDRQPASGRPTLVRIQTGYTNESTLFALRHEFGHVFGLEHGEGPGSLMTAETSRLERLARPNVTERALTWQSGRIRVFVDRSGLPGNATTVDRQLSAAFDYYRDGANGTVPATLSIARVDDREAADVVVTGTSMDAASNASLFGADTDADPALEYYTEQTIRVSTTIDPETLGWHVGYWVGDSLTAAENPTELPPPFDDPAVDPRRNWWR